MRFMSVRSFLDTNVLVYTDDDDAPKKKRRALELYADCRSERSGVVSTQVLQEYFVTVTKKLRVDTVTARRKTQLFGRLHLVSIELEDILGAVDLHRLHSLSFWDALIVRAALVSGCTRLYSEDMQDGFSINGLQIENPFR
jgi:predicted nucleic acid-binding protein